jgi:Domain of unknown function (DUF4282)
MKDWLTFDKLVTPKIITLIFWVAAGGLILFNLIGFIEIVRHEVGLRAIQALFHLVLWPVLLRVFLEAVVVIFRSNGITVTGGMPNLGVGADTGAAPPPAAPPPPSAPQGPPM